MTRVKPEDATTTEIGRLLAETTRMLGGLLEQLEWAEDEIEKAQGRHPEASAELHSSFRLLVPTHSLMETEFVYRAFVRELLERVACRADTRPGTWVEIAALMHDVSLRIPIHGAAVGLYCRAWEHAFPQRPLELIENLPHYEAIHGTEIDELEAQTRRKLAVAHRR